MPVPALAEPRDLPLDRSMFILKPLGDRRIRWLWGAQLLSATGAEFYMVALIWVSASLIGPNAGYVSAMHSAALLVGSLFGGIVTDRWRHGTTVVRVSLFRAALLGSGPINLLS